MSDEKVQLEVSVVSSGTEQLKQVNTEFDKLSTTTKTSTDGTIKQTAANLDLNTSIIKQVPQLQTIMPLLGTLGLSTLFTAAAVSALGVGLMTAGNSFMDTIDNMVLLGVAQENVNGKTQTFEDTSNEVTAALAKYGGSINDIIGAMSDLAAANIKGGASQDILDDAWQMSLVNGKSLKENIDALIAAMNGQGNVYDANGNKLTGLAAAQKVLNDTLAQSNTTVTFANATNEVFGQKLSEVGIVLGTVGAGLKTFSEMIVIGLVDVIEGAVTSIGTSINGIEDFFTGLWNFLKDVFTGHWQEVWDTIKGIANNAVQCIEDFFTGLWNFLKDVFTGHWQEVWDTIKGIANNAVQWILDNTINPLISAINAAISLLNKIPGVNIGSVGTVNIPKYASGVENFSGGAAIVGENGPELLNLPSGSSVTPNNRLGSNGGSNVYNFSFPNYVGTKQDIVDAVLEGIDSLARLRGVT